jgi:acetyl-CoA acetyltransferase family protein
MQNSFPEIVIVNGARTPMGRYCGKLRDFTAQELAAVASVEAMNRAGVVPVAVDHCVMGNAQQTSSDAIYGARHVALKAGVPVDVPALTVNRLCGSGMQSVVTAAQMIQLGEAKCVLAGGMESMSQAPHTIRGMRWGVGFGEGKLEDSLYAALTDTYCNMPMAVTAEAYAGQQGVTREAQDDWALVSQQRAESAYQAGRIQEELVPVPLLTKHGELSTRTFAEDDHRRPETTLESLAKLKPSFGKNGTVTAGNASGIVDGAAAVIVMPIEAAQVRELTPMARIVSWGIAGVEPSLMGSGPVPATQIALKKAGLRLSDIDLIELNEAFAAQCLAVMRELELDPAKTNVNGGAIALGHPLGATGTRLLITLMYELRRRKARYGLATACIGGGQGIAVIIENLQR